MGSGSDKKCFLRRFCSGGGSQKNKNTMIKGQRYVYAKPFVGEPTLDNFRLEEYELEDINEGEILCEAEFLSVDPYMRPYMQRIPVGTTMIGEQIAKVIKSKNEEYPVGSYVCAKFGWTTHNIVKPKEKAAINTINNDGFYLLPDFGDIRRSLGVGCLGMPGNTAYFGLLELCQPKAGETVVVTAAAGAVGSMVGQIAKIKGCTVIGFAGTAEKCDLLRNEFGFDHVINYKTDEIAKSLKVAAPKGVDCYFDNVGGELSSTIISQMNYFGRIAVCGAISAYNATEKPRVTDVLPVIVTKMLKMEGFVVTRWSERYAEGISQMLQWIREGKIKYTETMTDGFVNMPTAFMEMLAGKNVGKAVVRA